MASFLDSCKFTATASGTGDWTVSALVAGYQTPASAGAVNGATYRYRAESADLTQWEVGTGTYNTTGPVLARTTVLYNSSGTGTGAGQSGAGSKINFSAAPQVGITALAEDLGPAWSTWTPTPTPSGGSFTSASASGGYYVLGKIVFFSVTITITTVGTATGSITIGLPVGTANRAGAVMVQESAAVGFSGYGRIISGNASVNAIAKYDNSSYIGAGNSINCTGFYEMQ